MTVALHRLLADQGSVERQRRQHRVRPAARPGQVRTVTIKLLLLVGVLLAALFAYRGAPGALSLAARRLALSVLLAGAAVAITFPPLVTRLANLVGLVAAPTWSSTASWSGPSSCGSASTGGCTTWSTATSS